MRIKKMAAAVLLGMTCMYLLPGCARESAAEAETASEELSEEEELSEASPESEEAFVESPEPKGSSEASSESEAKSVESPASEAASDPTEAFAEQVRAYFLQRDWEQLAEVMDFPISIDGTQYETKEEFLAADFSEDSLNPYFFVEMEEESCRGMFRNWQGTMMGSSGCVWISDDLKVFAVNGLTKVTGLPGEVSMKPVEGKITRDSLTVTLENETDLNILFGDDYRLQKEENGAWTDLAPLSDEMAYHDIAYTPTRGNPVEWTLDVKAVYGSLEDGSYVLIKKVRDLDAAEGTGDFERSFGFLIGGEEQEE